MKIKLLLLLISILSYWEISFLQCSVQWDMLDVILPWRFHVGECLRHCYFPFWNPYQSTGYPIHADLQCPTWYPETILIGATTGYSNITLHILFILYIFIAGVGIFKLTKHFGTDNVPAFISGFAFMLTGIFVSHTQHLFIIVSLAWIPWALLYYMKISSEPFNFNNVLTLSIFTFLLISGGYQALSIVTGYLFFVLFVFYCIRTLIHRDYHSLVKIIKSNIAWAIITTGLCLVIISSLQDVFKSVERLSGMSLEQAQDIPFTPRSLISLLVPYGVVKDPGYFKTDISMTNLYMGIFILGFFLAGLFIKLKTELKIILIFSFVFLLASFGNHLPVRRWLYDYIPLMDLFRIPGFLKVMIVIPIIVTGGVAIDSLLKGAGKIRKWIIIPFTLIGCLLLLVLIWSAVKVTAELPLLTGKNISLSELISSASVFTHVLIHSIIQLFFLIVFFLLYYKKVRMGILIPVFIFIEMFLSVRMNIKYTGCSTDFNPLVMRAELKERPGGFPLPPPDEIAANTDAKAQFAPFWRNVNIFNKTVSFDAFTSFKLKGYKYLEDKLPALKEAILKNQLVYLSDQIYNEDEYFMDSLKIFHPKELFFSGEDFTRLDVKNITGSPGDTVILTSFNPNEISAHAITKQKQIITLLQSNYKGWKVLMDGVQVPHFTSNHLFISVQLPPGDHEIIFRYSKNIVKAAFIFSYSLFLVILFILLWNYVKKKHPKPIKIIIPVFLTTLILLVIILFLNKSRQNRSERLSALMKLSTDLKETGEYVYSSFIDFDTINDDWKGNKIYLDSTHSYSGNYSNRLDSINKFSYTLGIPCSEIAGNGIFKMNISASVFLPEKMNTFIVLHIKRDDKTVGYYTLNLNEAVTERNAWEKVFFSKYLRINRTCKDQISIYVWNNSKGTMWVDDLNVNLLKK